jgi:dolichyl-phosphate beta-glucosyltransferase
MKRWLQFVISLVVGGLVLRAVLRQFDFSQMSVALRQARFGLLALGLGLMILAYLVRGARWRIWESSLSYWDSLRLILIGFMGNNVFPARLGEILRAHCASAKTRSDLGRTAALASIAAERILDGLVLAVFGIIGMALVPVEHRLRLSLFLVSLAFAIAGLMLVLSIHWHEQIRRWIDAANRRFPGHVTAFVQRKSSHFLNGLLPLGAWSRMLAAIAVTAVIWAIETVFYYCVGLAVWNGMSFRIALLLLVAANFASLIPLTIGGIGTIEAVALSFLVSAGVPRYPALAMILLQHADQYFFTTLTGGIFYFAGGFYHLPLRRGSGDADADPAGPAGNDSSGGTSSPGESSPGTSSPGTSSQSTSSPSMFSKSTPGSASSPAPGTPAKSSTGIPFEVLEHTRSRLSQLGEVVELKPAARAETRLSIVIPAFNEQARLPRTVLETIRWCTTHNLDFELILADDGSRDATLALARLFEENDARVRALACPHMGKGAAVRMGMLNARGESVLFMDADGATPLAEIPKLLAAVEGGYDVAIGSRVMQSPGEVEVKTPIHRKIIGRVFAFFVNLFAIEGIGDTQCGFKMFRREAAQSIFSRQKTAGFAFDVEVLFLARRTSLSIAEIPVNWVAQPGSKVNLMTDSLRMLWDISHIRWLHRKAEPRRMVAASGLQSEPEGIRRSSV